MAALLVASAFFSGSEAALFCLNRTQRRRLASGNRAQRVAAGLLEFPERLLTTVLFGNLLVNTAYFTLDSIVTLELQEGGRGAEAGGFALVSLLALILGGEMLPKSLAVLRPAMVAAAVAIPLAAVVRMFQPVLPAFHLANLLSRRLLWPGFQREPYLQTADLERALRLSTDDATLLEQEQSVLEKLVSLSEIRADEMMRPRSLFRLFRAPLALSDLDHWLPPSGYLPLAEPESDEVTLAIPLRRLTSIKPDHLEEYAEPVAYVPWCASVARALEILQRQGRRVAAVVNEFGETIGILPLDDILETVFSRSPSRSERLLKRSPLRLVAPGLWHVTGMTRLRRLLRSFQREAPASKSVTVGGVIQEILERLPESGDCCDWGPFRFKVLDVPDRGQLLVELKLIDSGDEDSERPPDRGREAQPPAGGRGRGGLPSGRTQEPPV